MPDDHGQRVSAAAGGPVRTRLDVRSLLEEMDSQERMACRQEQRSLAQILSMIGNPEEIPAHPFVEVGHE